MTDEVDDDDDDDDDDDFPPLFPHACVWAGPFAPTVYTIRESTESNRQYRSERNNHPVQRLQ